MKPQQLIELSRLSYRDMRDPFGPGVTPKVQDPSRQQSSSELGNLASFENLEAFRAQARATGERFKHAFEVVAADPAAHGL